VNDRFARAGAVARVELAHEPDFRLGPIEVRPSLRELSGEGWRETIDRRVMQVLVVLARVNGKVVSRDDLIESCWDGVIVGDEAINRCISRLRKAAEASGNAFSIETVSRVGYRLKVAEAPSEAPSRVADENAAEAPAGPASICPSSSTPIDVSPSAHTYPTQSPAEAKWYARTRWPAVAALLMLAIAGLLARSFLWHARPKAPAISENSVAVLPFVNMSGDPSREMMSDGISEELLDELSNVSALRVAARTSSFAFRGKNTDVRQIGSMLSVHSVLEGSIREDGHHIRISAQLINTADGFRIWSATYDRQMTGMLTLEDDIARAITAAITHKILPAPQALAGRPASIDPDVYRKYLEGLRDMAPRDEAGVTKAVALFGEVTAAQPDFAAGYAALGRALINHAEDHPQQRELLPEAQVALARALTLDPNNLDALGARLDLALHLLDWRSASADATRMRAINPNSYPVVHELFRYYQHLGFPEQALEAAQGAALLDPLSEVDQLNAGVALVHLARFGEAAGVFQAALDRMPSHTFIRSVLCTAYAHSGEIEKSRAIAAQYVQANDKADADGCLFDIAVGQGRLGDARRINSTFVAQYPSGMSAVGLADNFAVLGDTHSAILWMERGLAQKDFDVFSVPFDRAIPRPLSADPGWKALTQVPLFRDWQAAHDRLAAELGVAE
jgi:TolB-like protein/DNA-binding winged helix-turn-helix (wHTH) protein/tetratricopeptide (TPR) repeat protein